MLHLFDYHCLSQLITLGERPFEEDAFQTMPQPGGWAALDSIPSRRSMRSLATIGLTISQPLRETGIRSTHRTAQWACRVRTDRFLFWGRELHPRKASAQVEGRVSHDSRWQDKRLRRRAQLATDHWQSRNQRWLLETSLMTSIWQDSRLNRCQLSQQAQK